MTRLRGYSTQLKSLALPLLIGAGIGFVACGDDGSDGSTDNGGGSAAISGAPGNNEAGADGSSGGTDANSGGAAGATQGGEGSSEGGQSSMPTPNGGAGGAVDGAAGAGNGGLTKPDELAVGTVEWLTDGEPHETGASQPPTVSVGKIASIVQMTLSAVDNTPTASSSMNVVLSISGPSGVSTIPAGEYPCAPASTLPSATVTATHNAGVFTSGGDEGACTLTLDVEAAAGGPVRGSIVGTLDGGNSSIPFEAAFNLVAQ
jgi:hypothetical protein